MVFKLFRLQVMDPRLTMAYEKEGNLMAHLTEKSGSAASACFTGGPPRGSPPPHVPAPGEEGPEHSPDWLLRLDVNWGWGRHIVGEDINPQMKGSLGTQDQAEGSH